MTGPLSDAVNRLLQRETTTSAHELQTTIHPEVRFKRNSLNLLIGRRGSGKTYNVFRELIKLGAITSEYTQLLYITNKLSDTTYHKMKAHLRMQVVKIRYDEVEAYLKGIIEAKEDYQEIVEKQLGGMLEPTYEQDIKTMLNVSDFSRRAIHTAVLYDDAIEVFKNKRSTLYKYLFENRQPKITYFMCIQDPFALDASVKANIDTLWLFGGYSPQKFNSLYQQVNVPYDREDLYSTYRDLTMNQALIIDYDRDNTRVSVMSD